MAERSIRIKRVRSHNVQVIEDLVYEPGRVTVFRGANASGKTSALRGILTILEGGSDPDIIRQGEDRAVSEIEVYVSGGLEGEDGATYSVKKVQTSGGARLEVRRDGVDQKAPKAIVEGLIHIPAADPGKLLGGTDKERLDALLAACEVKLPEEFAEEPEAQRKLPPLETLDAIEERLTGERRATGRVVNALQGQLDTLLSKEVPTVEGVVEARGARERAYAEKQTAQNDRDRFIEKAEKARRAAIEQIQEEFEAARMKARDECHEIEKEQQRIIDRAELTINQASRAESHSEELERVGVELKGQAAELRALETEVAKVRKLRAEAFEALPIPGITVDGGVVHHQGVPWEKLNTAKRVAITFRLLELGCPEEKLLVICSDALNDLDPDTRRKFFQAAEKKENVHFFMEDVAEGPLEVVTDATD